MSLYVYRLEGAILLDAGMYEGIESDRSVTWQAAATVVLSSLAAGVGSAAWFGWHAGAMIAIAGIALVTWVAWASLICHIGSRMLPEPETQTDMGELLRTTGFAAAPGLLQVLAVLPGLAGPVVTLSTAWMFLAMVVAVKHALDYRSTLRALAVCAVAAGMCLAVAVSLALLLTSTAS